MVPPFSDGCHGRFERGKETKESTRGKEKALRRLTSSNKRSAGRNPSGRITVFYWGGGLNASSLGIVERIEYDLNCSFRIASRFPQQGKEGLDQMPLRGRIAEPVEDLSRMAMNYDWSKPSTSFNTANEGFSGSWLRPGGDYADPYSDRKYVPDSYF
ncbi:hypothetical protein KP509_1Z258600 [Ceratopteris richardii]|nr:hypothetical protein KP509_1Z258600 [Ceratopteris richardii]